MEISLRSPTRSGRNAAEETAEQMKIGFKRKGSFERAAPSIRQLEVVYLKAGSMQGRMFEWSRESNTENHPIACII